MRAAAKGIVEHRDIALQERQAIDSSAYRHGHGAKVNGHMVAHGDDLTRSAEDGARIITALFNVRRKRGAAQRRAHLLSNGVEEVPENLDLDRIAKRHGPSVYRKPECSAPPGELRRFF
jgi:hypothetical protein